MTTRDATVRDVPEIERLVVELAAYEGLAGEISWGPGDLENMLFGEGAVPKVLLAESEDGEVVGFALYFFTFSTFLGRPGIWLEDLFVSPSHRAAGHGKELLGRLRRLTDGRVEWNVLDWNESSIGFYESLGARPVTGWTTYRWLAEPRTETPE
ncbi:MAG: GNAT family N-acetyltransferase [Acidimicrobiales bacterium]